ncbi:MULTISPECIES: hypothetical protein [unclassified Streptomyces]|jgi:sugar phosphate permease|uniref:hypothetical protein n=1 Tax=unclassified Streptomyces TaxID=2593676 RepID=UPI000AE71894|nr:hypothetical protein [Streptomyces sp. MI02-2A]
MRLVSGPLADRSRRFWAWAIAGYALTAVSVPVLGLTGDLWVACTLVVAERVGKAVRSPAKDTLLSHATAATGRGRGFAVHEAMDQVGALLGPLTVAGVTGVRRNATHFRNSPRAQSDMTCVGHVVCRHIPARSRRQGHGRPAGPGRARSAAGVSVSPRRLKALPLAE